MANMPRGYNLGIQKATGTGTDGDPWIPETSGGAGGGGGGAVTVVDGGDVTQGAVGNAAATDATSAWSVIALLKGLWALLAGVLTFNLTKIGGTNIVTGGTAGSQAIGGIKAAGSAIGGINPLLLGASDGTNLQQLLTALALGDGVNGNNELPVVLYGWNGATYDRLQLDGSKFLKTALQAGTALIGKVGVDQTTPGTTDSVSVKSNAYKSQITVTRPANVTAYTAGDVIGDTGGSAIITFTNVGPSGGFVLITGADLRIDIAAVPSGMTSFRLHLYDAAPTAIADNAAWDLPAGDRAAYLGYIDLNTPTDLGSTIYTQADGVNKQVKLATASTSLYGLLQTVSGYTPAANSEVYTPKLRTIGV